MPKKKPFKGWYGGTFNPIHVGHVAVAHQAIWQGVVDEVCFLPAFGSPFKHSNRDLLSYENRCELLNLAMQGEPNFSVSTLESTLTPDADGRVYTAQVIRAIQAQQKADGVNRPIYWLLGHDALASLSRWSEPQFLIEHVQFIQAPRSNQPPIREVELGGETVQLNTIVLDMPCVEVSSEGIRRRCWAGESIEGLVPQRVARGLLEHHPWSCDTESC